MFENLELQVQEGISGILSQLTMLMEFILIQQDIKK